jgi:hypothetical protein
MHKSFGHATISLVDVNTRLPADAMPGQVVMSGSRAVQCSTVQCHKRKSPVPTCLSMYLPTYLPASAYFYTYTPPLPALSPRQKKKKKKKT